MNDSAPPQPRRRWYQFSLRAMLLLTTIAAVSLGLIQTAVVLGIAFLLASPAALVRTARAATSAETLGQPMSTMALVRTFANSLVVVVSMVVAWLCTFVIGCLAAGLLVVIVLASVCRFLAACFARVSLGARWLEERTLCGIARCTAVNGSLRRQFWLQGG